MAHLTDWKKRLKITIDHTKIDSNLTYFPIALVLSTSAGISDADISCIFDEIGANSKKIAVTKDDGVTQLNVEIETWNSVTEKAVLWVSKSDLVISSTTDTILYLYYDGGKANNTTYVGDVTSTPAKAVWDTNAKAVWHMAQDPTGGTGSIKDSTSNNNHGTPAGSMTSGDLVDDTIGGKALDFDGSNDLINVPYSASIKPTSTITLLGVAYSADWTTFNASLSNLLSCTYGGGWFMRAGGSDALAAYFIAYLYRNSAYGVVQYALSSLSAGIHTFAVKYDGRYLKLLVDGVEVNSNDAGGNYAPTYSVNNSVVLAGQPDNAAGIMPGYEWTGPISEIRICNTARVDAWLKATHYTITDSFVSWGTEEVSSVEDFSLDLAVHGYHVDLFSMILEVTSIAWSMTDFKLNLDVVAQVIDSFKMLLEVVLDKLDDFKMLLEVTDGTVFDNFTMMFEVTDGIVFDNFKMDLSVISATPAFRSVTAHRLTPVMHEVV